MKKFKRMLAFILVLTMMLPSVSGITLSYAENVPIFMGVVNEMETE